jgi:hypothetical protein
MDNIIDKEILYGEWIHSKEEDTNEEIVYRPMDYDFPLTRSPRNTFQFDRDGKLRAGEPSPSDKMHEKDVNWELNDDIITISSGSNSIDTQVIASLEKDRLVLKRQ